MTGEAAQVVRRLGLEQQMVKHPVKHAVKVFGTTGVNSWYVPVSSRDKEWTSHSQPPGRCGEIPMSSVVSAETSTTPRTRASTALLGSGRLPKPTWQLWFDDEEHERDKDQYETEIEGCSTYTGCSRDSHHEGQHAPCGHIIHRGAGRGGASERRLKNTAVSQDANQHREGGDAHGDPHQQGEGEK